MQEEARASTHVPAALHSMMHACMHMSRRSSSQTTKGKNHQGDYNNSPARTGTANTSYVVSATCSALATTNH